MIQQVNTDCVGEGHAEWIKIVPYYLMTTGLVTHRMACWVIRMRQNAIQIASELVSFKFLLSWKGLLLNIQIEQSISALQAYSKGSKNIGVSPNLSWK